MKIKKILSALLAAAIACSLLCMPALAAESGNTVDTPAPGRLWLDLEEWDVEKNVSVTLVDYVFGTFTKEETDTVIPALSYVPLGVTLSAEENFLLFAFSDPDGDGKYECRWNYGYGVIPLPDEDPTVGTRANYFWWGMEENNLGSNVGPLDFFLNHFDLNGASGRRTLTTDYLVELFGPNTIIELRNSTFSGWLYLTGEERSEGLASAPAKLNGVTAAKTKLGYLASGWAMDIVDEAYYSGLIPGFVESSHHNDLRENITRAEFAAIAVELYKAMGGEEAGYTGNNPFADVQAGTDEYTYIMTAYELGIVKGVTDTTFQPGALVSRQDAALMLSRVYTILGGTVPAGAGTTFSDDADIAPYAKDAVAFMTSKGIINGMGGSLFAPKGNATVEQALKIALEMLDNLGA